MAEPGNADPVAKPKAGDFGTQGLDPGRRFRGPE
jgi:hypothetical protein